MIMIIVKQKCQMKTKKILKYNRGEKVIKSSIYHLFWLRIFSWKKCTRVKIEKTKHAPSVYSLCTNCSFDATKNKLDCYKSEDCMERFCKELREHALRIIHYE